MKRLKCVFEPLWISGVGSRRQAFVFSNPFLIIPLIMGVFGTFGQAMALGGRCDDRSVLSSLDDSPVAIQRVERVSGEQVRVFWSLRTDAEEFNENSALPRNLQTGSEFDVLRCLPPGRWVALGQGEVVARNGNLVEGLLRASGQPVTVDRGVQEQLLAVGNLYPAPMVGDQIVVRKKEIIQVKKVSPRITLPVVSLFGQGGSRENDKSAGLSIDLSSQGREKLRDVLTTHFADARGQLLIEVHAQRAGSRQRLREETTLRAQSIERFLRYEFSIAKDQLIAIGHGADGYTPGFVPANFDSDYVVLRLVSTNLARD